MFSLEFLAAQHGDCILIRWGEAGKVMLVDGGPSTVYEDVLKPRLLKLPHQPNTSPTLDVVCVSHIDDDHIVGILRMLVEIHRARQDYLEEPFRICRFWHNSVDALIDVKSPGLAASVDNLLNAARSDRTVAASYNQGRDVRNAAAALGIAGNPPFSGPIVQGSETVIDDLKIVAVSPSQDALDKLTEKWKTAKLKKDEKVIAAAYADHAVPNLSSIALHLSYGGQTVLLTGDARGDYLVKGLEATGILMQGKDLHVDLLKVPHHGSNQNVTKAFFERIIADAYVFSGNGKHGNPERDTLEWLVEARGKDAMYDIYLTYPVDKIDAKRKLEMEKKHKVWDFAKHSLEVFFKEKGSQGYQFTLHSGAPIEITLQDGKIS